MCVCKWQLVGLIVGVVLWPACVYIDWCKADDLLSVCNWTLYIINTKLYRHSEHSV